jgi:hypothetical protein
MTKEHSNCFRLFSITGNKKSESSFDPSRLSITFTASEKNEALPSEKKSLVSSLFDRESRREGRLL